MSNRVLCIAIQSISHARGKTVNASTRLITKGPTTNIVYHGLNTVQDKGSLHQEAESSQVIRFGMATMKMRIRHRSRNEELVHEREKQPVSGLGLRGHVLDHLVGEVFGDLFEARLDEHVAVGPFMARFPDRRAGRGIDQP